MCESLFADVLFPQISSNTWMSCQRYPWIGRPSVPGTTTWTLALRLGVMETKLWSTFVFFLFVFFEFQMCLVGTQYIYDIYICTHIIHIM